MADEPSGVSVWSPHIADESLVRKFISLNSSGYVAISIQDTKPNAITNPSQAVPVDPDLGSLTLTVWFANVINNPPQPGSNPYGTQVLQVTQDSLTRVDVGKFFYNIGPSLTSNRGLLTCVWTYTINGVQFQFTDHMQILDAMPLYDSLSESERMVVENVSWMFGDLFDSVDGGPHLLEEFQSHWNYERIAQMQKICVYRMNFIGNFCNAPTQWDIGTTANSPVLYQSEEITKVQQLPDGQINSITYPTRPTSTGGSGVPPQLYGLVVLGTYLECMRHLRDSYTEIPQRPGMDVAYTDRTQYQQRWQANLSAELQDWKQAVKASKMSLLNMSKGSLLVGGGIYGGSAMGVFQAGTYAAQTRSWRMYPAASAVMWGATGH